jgi:branched-chain amino acid transport system permease protein
MQEFLQQLINGLSVGSIYALIAVGYTMVYGVLQLINFAHGDIFMVGAMVALYAATGRVPPSMPWWLHGVIVGGLTAWFLIAWLVGGRSPIRCLRSILPLAVMYLLSVPLLWIAYRLSRPSLLPGWLTREFTAVTPAILRPWAAPLFVLLVSLTACGSLGFIIERLAYRPLRDKPRINSLITAIGISLLLEYGGQNPAVFGATPQAFPAEMVPGIGESLFKIHGVTVGRVDALVLGVTLLLMLVLSWIVLKTRTGLALRAVSFRFDTASLMGVDVDRVIGFTFVLGSTLAAAAGFLFAEKYPEVQPLMGLFPGVKAFVAAVFGGIGNIAGAVVGALVLGMVEVLVVGYLPNGSQYKEAVAFVILIAILLVKPSGLFGKHVIEKV